MILNVFDVTLISSRSWDFDRTQEVSCGDERKWRHLLGGGFVSNSRTQATAESTARDYIIRILYCEWDGTRLIKNGIDIQTVSIQYQNGTNYHLCIQI